MYSDDREVMAKDYLMDPGNPTEFGTNVNKFDSNLSAIENLRNLTKSLDLVNSMRTFNTLSSSTLHH